MGQINLARVVGGGLLAGLIMNVSEFVLHAIVLGPDGEKLLAEWKRAGIAGDPDPTLLLWLVIATFALGLLAVWTYAAIRPRLGAGAEDRDLRGSAGLGPVVPVRRGLRARRGDGVPGEAHLAAGGLEPGRGAGGDPRRGLALPGVIGV